MIVMHALWILAPARKLVDKRKQRLEAASDAIENRVVIAAEAASRDVGLGEA